MYRPLESLSFGEAQGVISLIDRAKKQPVATNQLLNLPAHSSGLYRLEYSGVPFSPNDLDDCTVTDDLRFMIGQQGDQSQFLQRFLMRRVGETAERENYVLNVFSYPTLWPEKSPLGDYDPDALGSIDDMLIRLYGMGMECPVGYIPFSPEEQWPEQRDQENFPLYLYTAA